MVASVLATAIGMSQQSLAGQATLERQRQGVDDQATLHVVRHGPANHAPGVQVLDDGEVEPAFPGRGKLAPFEEENRRLRAENKRLLAERDILKKAAAFFAKEAL